MTDLIQRPRRLRKSPALRAMFEETTLSLNDLVLPIFVEEEIDDYKAVEAMPGVMRIPEKHLAREITPCVAAIAAIKRELGMKWAVGVVIWQCAIAWAAALMVKLVVGIFV